MAVQLLSRSSESYGTVYRTELSMGWATTNASRYKKIMKWPARVSKDQHSSLPNFQVSYQKGEECQYFIFACLHSVLWDVHSSLFKLNDCLKTSQYLLKVLVNSRDSKQKILFTGSMLKPFFKQGFNEIILACENFLVCMSCQLSIPLLSLLFQSKVYWNCTAYIICLYETDTFTHQTVTHFSRPVDSI